jgi:hypothetical protein
MATANSATSSGGVYRDILEWSAALPRWQHELLRRLLANAVVSADDVNELAREAVAESQHQPSAYSALSEGDLPSLVELDEHRLLIGMHTVQNVNALRHDQQLTFGNELTIVYGDNASGKSGYARVLKRTYRARVVEDILPDVRAEGAAAGVPAAVFRVKPAGSDELSIPWTDETKPIGLGRFAVLDGACASTYVSGGELSAGPAGIDIPARFAEQLDVIKRRIQALASASEPNKDRLRHLENGTPTGEFVKTLSSTTSDDAITAASQFTPEDQHELETLVAELAAARSVAPSARRRELQAKGKALESLHGRVSTWKTAVADERLDELRQVLRSVKDADAAVLATKQLGDSEAPSARLGSAVWTQMLAAVVRYVTSLHQADAEHLAVEGRCPLCWQGLDLAAKSRLDRFRSLLEGEAEKSKQRAIQRREEILAAIHAIPAFAAPEDEVLVPEGQQGASALQALLASLAKRREGIAVASEHDEVATLPEYEDRITSKLAALREEVASHLQALPATDGDAAKRVASLEERRLVLDSKKSFAAVASDVREFVVKAREYQLLKTVGQAINTRDASKKATQLHDTHMTETYSGLFNEELGELRFRRRRPVLVHKPNKAKVRVTPLVSEELKNLSVERVFSEGERTAIALACFLAEARLGADRSGLIFDDPVSSLDHHVREHVARRLVAAARERQVIVFTHDLAFFSDLRTQAKLQAVDCQCRTLSATEYDAGFVEAEEPFGARGVKKRSGHLTTLIVDVERAAKAGDLPTLRSKAREFYDGLRTTWERFVEERMFAKAVQRLEKNVIVGALNKVVCTPEIVRRVQEGHRRCSETIASHDHAPAQGQSSYSIEAMKADLASLIEAEKMVPSQ